MQVQTEKKRISRESFRRSMRIFRYIAPYRVPFIIGLICLAISSVSSLAIFSSLGELIDFTQQNFKEKVWQVTLLLGVLLIVQAITSYLRIYTFSIVTENSIAKLRKDVFNQLLILPMQYYASKRTGELSSRISSDISTIKDSLTTYLAEFIRQIIIIIGSVAIMWSTSWKLALFMLATLPALALFAVSFGRYVRKLSKKAQNQVAESQTIVEETLTGMVTVKAFTGEWFESRRYAKVTDDLIRTGMKNAIIRGIFASTLIVFLFGSVVAIVWFGSDLVAKGEITGGNLFQFFLLSVFMAGSVGGLADTYSQLQKSIGATENLLDILDEKPEMELSHEFKKIDRRFEGSIEFNNVCFAYPSRKEFPVIRNLSFNIEPGKQLAIVGSSGAGKSTITALLLRLFEPTSGVILVDGKSVVDYDLTFYRSQIALVPQDVILFGGTIRDNILYGKPDATEEEIIEAARKANAHEFITSFPDGYDTIVGERGTKLSGGQRQRIAIARAVLSDPAILLLDEATSSLDSESERQVQDALEKLMQGRTSIVIAHRLSTIRNADQILVIDRGELVEKGNHQTLVQKEGGLYKYLVGLQVGM
ncbi:MAG: ABC transporter transmembrane domain-containing protein [Flavobacteriales bacterium]|nr:ABC transporter transmembrane domain-containing protein [Flavobacteriales bacterium]